MGIKNNIKICKKNISNVSLVFSEGCVVVGASAGSKSSRARGVYVWHDFLPAAV